MSRQALALWKSQPRGGASGGCGRGSARGWSCLLSFLYPISATVLLVAWIVNIGVCFAGPILISFMLQLIVLQKIIYQLTNLCKLRMNKSVLVLCLLPGKTTSLSNTLALKDSRRSELCCSFHAGLRLYLFESKRGETTSSSMCAVSPITILLDLKEKGIAKMKTHLFYCLRAGRNSAQISKL